MAIALLVAAAVIVSSAAASAGPVKTSPALPGRDVRAVPLRGAVFGRDPLMRAVAGRDGWMYAQTSSGLFRITNANGANVRATADAGCSGGWPMIASRTPGVVCEPSRNRFVYVTATGARSLRFPIPDWTDAADEYRYDYEMLTHMNQDASGLWRFLYGFARGYGETHPDGSTTLRRYPQLGVIRSAAFGARGETYVIDDRCQLARISAFGLMMDVSLPCTPGANPTLVSASDGVWILSLAPAWVERRGIDGTRRRFDLPFAPADVAVGKRSGTAYIVGFTWTGDVRTSQPRLATIARSGAVEVNALPMNFSAGIAVDDRERLWIPVPQWHAFAVIAPKGTWN